MNGARAAAESLGYVVHMIDAPITGEASLAARDLLEYVGRIPRLGDRPSSRGSAGSSAVPGLCIISGGETTVRTAGSGKGGRNQEFALAMVRGLERLGGQVAAASVGTDGVDGPTDAAGAIVDSATGERATAAGAGDVERYLREHNSYLFFDQLGDLIRTGPTGTNVGDLQVILTS
jgi:hydroxypyruvate reductase